MRLRVRVPIGDRVSILDPVQVAVFANNDVRVGVKLQEWSKFIHALLDQSTEEDPAVAIDGTRDQDVGVAKRPGECQATEEPAQLDPAQTRIPGRRLIQFTCRVITA